MSGSYPNPFFTDPGVGRAFGSLAEVFIPNPDREAMRRARDASAGLDVARTGEVQQRMQGYSSLAEVFRQGGTDPAAMRTILGGLAGTTDPAALAQAGQLLRAYGFSQGVSPEQGAQLFQGAGGAFENTQPGFQQQDATRRRGQDVAAGAQTGSARIAQEGALARLFVEEMGRDRRMAPEINPNNVVVVPPNSPLAGRANDQGRIEGNMRPQTFEGARAAAVPDFINPPTGEDPEVTRRRRELVAPSVVGAEVRGANGGRPPMDINGTDAIAIDAQIRSNLPTGFDVTPAARTVLRSRAAELYQQTRNLPVATEQAVREFMTENPPRADSEWWWFSNRTYDLPPSMRRGSPATGQPAPRANPARPISRQEYDALPNGARYTDPMGRSRIKGGA